MPQRKTKNVVVHLGNVNEKQHTPSKTELLARRFPTVIFKGIDHRLVASTKPNWTQTQGDLVTELKKLPNNSITTISSELTLGYYPKTELGKDNKPKLPNKNIKEQPLRKLISANTTQILLTAYRKLKRGGQLHFVVDEDNLGHTINQIKHSPFKQAETVAIIPYKATARTYWMTRFAERGKVLLQITLKKN